MTVEALSRIERIAESIKNAGYDPIEQLYGYYLTGRTVFITRLNNARTEILQVDVKDLEEYLKKRMQYG